MSSKSNNNIFFISMHIYKNFDTVEFFFLYITFDLILNMYRNMDIVWRMYAEIKLLKA